METWILALGAFLVTVVLVLWRPGNMHEAVPALLGAFAMFLVGLLDRHDVLVVLGVVWNSAMTIIATFLMAAVLERAGFFDWVSDRLIQRAQGSGRRLFHLVVLFSACLTLFLNNDGSILLGTPVVIGLVDRLRLPRRAAFAYLIAACLIASAASPPVGVSNMANLEAMSLVGISLVQHLRVVVAPALVGLAACWGLLYTVFRSQLPERVAAGLVAGDHLPAPPEHPPLHLRHPHALPFPRPLPPGPPHAPPEWHPAPPPPPRPHASGTRRERPEPDRLFMWCAVGVVVLVRVGFFAGSLVGIPTYLVALAGAAMLLAGSVARRLVDARETVRQAPWPILGFAFGMDLVVFGLRNAGLTVRLAHWVGPAVAASGAGVSFLPGLLAAAISALLNNHPGLITGSLMLLDMGRLSRSALDVAYSGVVLGSDLGALLTPVGTLASLMWFHILRQHGRAESWREYVRITAVVIPVSFMLALGVLFGMSFLS